MVVQVKEPTIPITEIEQSAFCQTDDELKTKTLEEEFGADVRWQKLPIAYLKKTPEELEERILEAKAKLEGRLVMLGHHYQRNEVIRFADYIGDSFKLSQFAATQEEAEYIIFCGVHFMAETADILSGRHQKVILPNLTAGCSMADMAHVDDVLDCWEDLEEVLGDDGGITPITYMNSTAAIKALCGRNDGIVCTSSNAKATFEWAFQKSGRVLFLPDQHLGRNTAVQLGVGLDEMVVWNPFKPLGGHTPDELRRARVILWQGHCSVHTRFTVRADRGSQAASTRRERAGASRVHVRRGAGSRHERVDRVHHSYHRRRRAGKRLGRGNGDQPGQPCRPAEPRQDRILPGLGRLPLLHHV